MALLQRTQLQGSQCRSLLMPQRPQRGRLVIQNASKVTGKIKLALVAGKVRSGGWLCGCVLAQRACKPPQRHRHTNTSGVSSARSPSLLPSVTHTFTHTTHRPTPPRPSALRSVARCVCLCVWERETLTACTHAAALLPSTPSTRTP